MEVMSTEVTSFKKVASEFMKGQAVTLMCLIKDSNGNLVIHGGFHGKETEIQDCMIEVEEEQ